jgi:hypothetical protein
MKGDMVMKCGMNAVNYKVVSTKSFVLNECVVEVRIQL